jgi:hypothetical protein
MDKNGEKAKLERMLKSGVSGQKIEEESKKRYKFNMMFMKIRVV